MYQRSPASSSMRPKQSDPASSLSESSRRCELPLHRLGVGLVGGEHVLVGDPGGGAPAHRLEAVLREPQARAFERNVRVGHFADDSGRDPAPTRIFARLGHVSGQAQALRACSCAGACTLRTLSVVTTPPMTGSGADRQG